MDLCFFNYDTKYKDLDDKLLIMIYGITKDGKDIYIRIQDFYFPIKLQLSEKKKWNSRRAADLVEKFKSIKSLAEIGHAPKRGELVWERVYYGAAEAMEHPEKPFLVLHFRSMEGAKHFRNYINKSLSQYGVDNIYEWSPAIIDPVKKMFSVTGANYCQWHRAIGNVPKHRTSNFDLEYIVKYNTLKSIPQEESIQWTLDFRIMSFDFEMFSSNPNRLPEAWMNGDVIYLGTFIFKTIGKSDVKKYAVGTIDIPENIDKKVKCKILNPDWDPESDPPELQYIETVKTIRRIILGNKDTLRVDMEYETVDYEYIKVKKELQIIDKMAELMQTHQPHIITGHNINSFDYLYADTRLDRKKEKREFKWPEMGRVFHEPTELPSKPKKWKSSGAGEVNLNILKISGRITIDTLNYVQRNTKLRKKDLGTVGKKFVGVDKIGLPAREQFKIYRSWLNAKKSGNLTQDVLEQTLRVVEYGVRDSEIPVLLFDNKKMNILLNQLVMSNVARTPIEEVLTGGEMRKCRSLLYNISMNEPKFRYVFTPREKVKKDDKYEGALVQNPKVGFWDPIIWLDFSSMYPTIIIAFNICHTTWIPPGIEFDPNKVNAIDIQDEHGNILRTHRFLKKEIRQGLLPKMVEGLINERNKYKKLLEPYEIAPGKYDAPEEEKPKLAMLETYSNKLKIIANSGYGFLGSVETNEFSFIEGAESVTAMGRIKISKVANYVREKYNGIIAYGDTDSVAVFVENATPYNCHDLGKKLADEVNSFMEKPMKITYEKSTRSVFIKKKFYISAFIAKDGTYLLQPRDKILFKGVLSARSDSCKWAQDTYNKCAYAILERASFRDVLTLLTDECQKLLDGKVPLSDLAVSAKVTESANDDYYIKQIARREEELGEEIEGLLEFVINKDPVVELKKGKKPGTKDKAVLVHKFDPKVHEIDVLYYIENKLATSLDALLRAAFIKEMNLLSHPSYIKNRDERAKAEELKKKDKSVKLPKKITKLELLNQAGYKPKGRKHFVPVDCITEIIARMVEDKVKLKNIFKLLELDFSKRKRHHKDRPVILQ